MQLAYSCLMLRPERPLLGPKSSLLSNTWKSIVWGDTCADKARGFIGKGHLGGEVYGQGTKENCSALWLAVSGFMVMGLVSEFSLANHSDSESFLMVHTLLRPRCMPGRRILGGGRTRGISFWPFPTSYGLRKVVSSGFLTRTSCRKIIHANCYYGAWLGWAVLVSVFPLTLPLFSDNVQ